MKNNLIIIFSLTLLVITGNVFAQVTITNPNATTGEIKLFDASFPPRISFYQTDIDNLFKLTAGAAFTINSREKVTISGTVIKIVAKEGNVKIISLNPAHFPDDTRFVITLSTLADKNNYEGFMMNTESVDAYKLSSVFEGFVVFSKYPKNKIVTE